MFIPLKDENPTFRTPVVTIVLIAINAAIYLYSYLQGTRGFEAFVFRFGLIPAEITHFTELTPRFAAPIWLTPLSSMFLHGGLMHLGGNMLFLWVFGNNIEDHVGPIKFILFYLAAGLAAVAAFVAINPSSTVPMVGASGAIAGIMGAYMVLFPRARILTLIFLFYFIRVVRVPAAVVLGFWIVYQIFMSAIAGGPGGGVAWLAHVGGFVFGWIWFKLFVSKAKEGAQRVFRMDWR